MLNVIDDPLSFADSSSTALLGSIAFRMLSTTPNSTNVTNSSSTPSSAASPLPTFAYNALDLVNSSINTSGWLENTVDPYTFNETSAPGTHSPEGQAFVLLLYSAWRDSFI
jgi:hypothetical protein